MTLSALGHRQTVADLPTPTEARGYRRWSTWALPGTTLSVASLAVFVMVALGLQADRHLRELYRLPIPAYFPALVALLLAWGVVWSGRRRPGRRFPRLWGLLLGTASTGVTILALTPPFRQAPWLHALATAALAAALVLAPRWLRGRPQGRLVEWVGPCALAAGLVFVLVPAVWLGHAVMEQRRAEFEGRLSILRQRRAELETLSHHDWSTLASEPAASEAVVHQLEGLSLEGLADDPGIWQTARASGRQDELAKAAEDLAAIVVAGLKEDRAPQLATVSEPAIRWDGALRRWIADPRFPRLSRVVGSYYQQMGRLLSELEPPASLAENTAYSRFEASYQNQVEEVRRLAAELRGTWTERWVVSRLPPGATGMKAESAALVDLLDSALTEGDAPPLRAADLWSLMSLEAGRVAEVDRRAPGCHARSYDEDAWSYLRLDCYAYAPDMEDSGAELEAELRLVYRGPAGGFSDSPREVYFLFPVPSGKVAEAYREYVIVQLAAAVQRHWSGLFYTDRGGSVVHGFRLRRDGRDLWVYPPRMVPFLGDGRAIEVRAVWADRP